MSKKNKNPVCAVWWYDASYCFEDKLPEKMPQPRLTVGFVVESNDEFINIVTDVGYDEDNKSITPERGHLIPEGAIVDFKKIDFLNKDE